MARVLLLSMVVDVEVLQMSMTTDVHNMDGRRLRLEMMVRVD